MQSTMVVALAVVLSATHEIPAGESLTGALAGVRPGDVVRLGPGVHRGALGRLAGIQIVGAGPDRTVIEVPAGEDGLVATGEVALSGVALRAALKVLGGDVRVRDAVLDGGACGAYLGAGRLELQDVDLRGGYGLLQDGGDAAITAGSARGTGAGLALLSGTLRVTRTAVGGPSREAGVSVTGGEATLEDVSVRKPGPSGVTVAGKGRVVARGLVVSGATEEAGIPGACLQARHGALDVEDAVLVRCGGAAVEASDAEVSLAGLNAEGAAAGCIVLVDGARGDLRGNVCTGHGPGLVLAGGARARLDGNRWRTDPAAWVDCGSGARAEMGPLERLPPACRAP